MEHVTLPTQIINKINEHINKEDCGKIGIQFIGLHFLHYRTTTQQIYSYYIYSIVGETLPPVYFSEINWKLNSVLQLPPELFFFMLAVKIFYAS